jgi:hypothetical protein
MLADFNSKRGICYNEIKRDYWNKMRTLGTHNTNGTKTDGFDNEWIDVCEPTTEEKAKEIWNKETNNGTKNTNFSDIDYYKIFPADTVMMFSSEGIYSNHRQGED